MGEIRQYGSGNARSNHNDEQRPPSLMVDGGANYSHGAELGGDDGLEIIDPPVRRVDGIRFGEVFANPRGDT